MQQGVSAFLHWLGYGLCHQLPERSFSAGGVQAPVCARDTGIYFGILLSLWLISRLHHGSRPRELPTPAGWTAIALMIGVMALDGVTEYSGLRPTTNEIRLMTGLMAGFAIGAILTPMINDELWAKASNERVLDSPWKIALWVAAVPVAYAVIYWVLPLSGIVYPLAIAVAILASLIAVNVVLVCMLPPFERRALRLSDAWLALLVALGLALLEVWLAGLLRAGILGVVALGLGS